MSQRWLKKFLLLSVAAIIIVVSITFWTATQATTTFVYAVTELASLGGRESAAYDINDSGQVVGYSYPNAGLMRSVLWENGAITADWKPLNIYNYASAINNAGQIACNSSPPSHVTGRCPYLWEKGKITYIGECGGSSYVNAINNVGQVAGWNILSQPFVWKDGLTTPLTVLDSNNSYSQALGINNKGQVVGFSSTQGKTHAVLWQNGTIKDLQTLPGGSSSLASSINRYGKVVGWSDTSSGMRQAVLWENGVIKDLGTFNNNATQATDINVRGTVVGYSFSVAGSSDGSSQQAFVWKNGIMRDLNKLLPANSGWELNTARAINNRGQIVGEGKFNGQQRAYLLTPTWVNN